MPLSLPHLSRLIQAEAIAVSSGTHEPIRLAAFLYAACRRLITEEASAETGFALAADDWTLDQAVEKLARLSPDLSPSALFGKILSALLAIDQSFAPDRDHPGPLHPNLIPTFTLLNATGDPDPILQGKVYHWISGPSVLRQARKFGRAHRGPSEFLDPVTRHLEHLSFYLSTGDRAELVSIRHELVHRPSQLERIGRIMRDEQSFRIGLCPLSGDWHPLFQVPEGVMPPGFCALERNAMAHAGSLERHLAQVIDQAVVDDLRLLVFPELSLDEPQRIFLENELAKRSSKLLAIIAGSFHTSDRPKPYNETVVLDASGFRFWPHRKNGRYSIPGGTTLSSFFPVEAGMFLSQELPEYIRYGDELLFFDSSLGRLVLLICADALDEEEPTYLPLIRKLRPDLVLVVSMSPQTEDFRMFVKAMVRQGVGVLFVNAACICGSLNGQDDSDLVFMDLALRELKESPPTRWRWSAADRPPQWFDRRRKIWVTLLPDEEEDRRKAVWRLRPNVVIDGGQGLGIVLDLVPFLSPLLKR